MLNANSNRFNIFNENPMTIRPINSKLIIPIIIALKLVQLIKTNKNDND